MSLERTNYRTKIVITSQFVKGYFNCLSIERPVQKNYVSMFLLFTSTKYSLNKIILITK